MSGTARPTELHRLQSKNRLGEVTATSAPIQPRILVPEVLEEIIHSSFLVIRARKEVREATLGDLRCGLGVEASRATYASYKGTYENVAIW